MSIKKRLLSAALALALGASLLTGCSKGADGSGSQSSSGDSSSDVQAMDLTDVTDPYLATAGVAGDTVVGTVGDYEVTADSLLYWLNYNINYTKQQYSAYGISDMRWDETSEDGTTTAQALLKTAMQLASFYRLLPELAAKEGLSVPQETIDGLKDDEASIIQQLGSETLKDHYFWMQMLTPALYQKMYQAGEASQLLQDEYFGEGTQGYPTDAEVKTYAEDELGYYRAKHILLLTKDMSKTVTNDDGTTGYAPLDDETIAQKKAKAEELLAQLQAISDPAQLEEKFDELMNANSEDTGLAANPDGYAFTTGEMVQEFEDATRALEPGQISGLVESSYGYHIILRLEPTCAPVRTMWNEDQLNTLTGQWVEQAEVVTTETYDNLSVGDFYDKLTAYRETLNTTSEEAEQENGQVEQDTGGEIPAQDGTSDGQTQEDAGAQDSGSKDAAPQEEGAADQGEKAPDDAGGESTPEE